MKKFCIIILIAIVGAISSASAQQCKVEDIFEKYKIDNRCNSVSMSKDMLNVIAKQRSSLSAKEDLKNISSIKILTVKIPKSRNYTSSMIDSKGHIHSTTFVDGESFNVLSDDSKERKESVEKAIKEKQAQKDAENRKKVDELTVLKQQVGKDADSCIETSKYTELMSVNEDGKMVKYFSKQVDDKIKEFIVVSSSSKEYSLIVIKGDDIKIESVSRLGDIIPNARIDVDDYIN